MKKRYLIAGAYGLAGFALAAKLWSRPRDVKWAEHREQLHHAEHSRFVDVDGVQVHYQEAGASDAPVLLLIHGFCASNFIWSDVLLPLAESGYRVIAPDLVGHGFSEKPRSVEHYTIDAQARMIVRLMDVLGIEHATLVGSSYGGAVSAFCALDAPPRVKRLVLVGAVTNDEVKQQVLLRLSIAPVMGNLLSPLLLGSERLVRWRMRTVYYEPSAHLLEDRRIVAHRRPLQAANTHRAMLTTLRRWSADRVEREAEHITQPTLLVWGDQDKDIPLRHGENLHKKVPDSRLIVFRRCGHLPQEERPAEFVQLVSDFCRAARAEKKEVSATEVAVESARSGK